MTLSSSETIPKKLVVFRFGTSGKDLACVSVGSYQEAIEIAYREYYSELKDIPRSRIRLNVTITLLDGTNQVARLTESGFCDTLDQFKPMKLVTVEIGPPKVDPPSYSDDLEKRPHD